MGLIKKYSERIIPQSCVNVENPILFARNYLKVLGVKFSKKEFFKINKNSNSIHLAIFVCGGFGDFLINANFIYHLSKFIEKNKNITIDIFAKQEESANLEAVFKGMDGIDNIFIYEQYQNTKGYDAITLLHSHLLVYYFNFEKIKKLNLKLYNFIKNYMDFREKRKDYGNSSRYHIAVANNQNRVQLPDVNKELNLKKELNFPLPYPDKDLEEKILQKFNLKNKKFITLNRGICINDKLAEGTKMWSFDKFNELVKKLKQKYGDIVFVQLGVNEQRCKLLDNIDLNLVGKTDFDDIKVLIKNSFLHFDCEGGFAHLRNALRAKHPAIVLFGPTSPEFYGYSSNINISKNVCPIHCDWVTASWQWACLRGETTPPCIDSITVEEVFEVCDKYLQENLIKG